jgi:hypothetical protein
MRTQHLVKGARSVTEILEAMTAPDGNGQIHAKRSGPKALLPSTWLNRSLRLEYVDAAGERAETTATLLDLYPAGPIMNVGGAKTMICWERLVLCELIND